MDREGDDAQLTGNLTAPQCATLWVYGGPTQHRGSTGNPYKPHHRQQDVGRAKISFVCLSGQCIAGGGGFQYGGGLRDATSSQTVA